MGYTLIHCATMLASCTWDVQHILDSLMLMGMSFLVFIRHWHQNDIYHSCELESPGCWMGLLYLLLTLQCWHPEPGLVALMWMLLEHSGEQDSPGSFPTECSLLQEYL